MRPRTIAALSIGLSLAAIAGSLTAGPIDPPAGPIAASYKTLSDVEPRVRISGLPFTINQPGSYYLGSNLTGPAGLNGITVNASNVTIDLNGCTLTGGSGAVRGIAVPAFITGLVVRNGTLSGWADGGVSANLAMSSRLENVTASGCGSYGLALGAKGTIRSCIASDCTGVGISGGYYITIADCNATDNGTAGISVGGNAVISNCQASATDNGPGIMGGGATLVTGCTATNNGNAGIKVSSRATVTNCTVYGNSGGGIAASSFATITGCTAADQFSGAGISAADGCTISNCTASGNSGEGITAGSNCQIVNNTCTNNLYGTTAGIHVSGDANRIDSNLVASNVYGIRADIANNLVVRNAARDNSSGNYSFPAGSEYGQIITNPGNAFVATNPWGNFSY